MEDYELTVYIATHKPFIFTKNTHYCPIQVNAKKNEHFLPVTDDTGDNISEKNDRFCELTALYWIWKNDHHSQYIGLCHYRRYFKMSFNFFDLKKTQYEKRSIDENDVRISSRVIKYLKKGFIILPRPHDFGKISVQEQYKKYHSPQDLQILKKIVLQSYPEYINAWDHVFHGHKLYAFNMFIMNRDTFNKYMTWLFSILFKAEKEIPPKEDVYQNRTFGFMAERLLYVYLEHEHNKIKELPIIFLV